MTDPKPMTYLKAENTFEGVRLTNTDTELNLSASNAEKLYEQLGECLAVAAGYGQSTVTASEVEPRTKIVLNGNRYTVRNVLDNLGGVTIQWQDYFGENGEITVPEDFELTVWERIE